MAKRTKPVIVYEVECDHDVEPVRGHFASGDDEADRKMEAEIIERIVAGDIWAWCCVRVKATDAAGAVAYSHWLGGCSYASEADFRDDGGEGYFSEMCDEARDALIRIEQSHRQGIQTKYFGPTNAKGSRVKVWAQAGVKYFGWDHALNPDENHAAAAKMYAEFWQWTGRWVGGAMPDGTGYLFVNVREVGE